MQLWYAEKDKVKDAVLRVRVKGRGKGNTKKDVLILRDAVMAFSLNDCRAEFVNEATHC
jgi:hypothetical protein